MSRLEHAIDRLRVGEPVVLIDEERPAGGHVVSALAALHRMRGLAAGPIETVFAAATPPSAGAEDSGVHRLAAPHGVLGTAPGAPEAAVDLLHLAGRPVALVARLDLPGGVLADETAAARRARREGLALVSVQDVIAHRLEHETIVDAAASARLPSAHAEQPLEIVAFRGRLDGIEHVALVHGPLGETPLVRLHSECLTGDALGSLRCDCGEQLRQALHRIGEDPQGGVVVYLRGQEGRGIGLVNKIRAYALQDLGRDTVEANEDLGFPADLRHYGIAVQMLRHLGIKQLRLLSNNRTKAWALERYGIGVAARVGIDIAANAHNAAYLDTKRIKMGHDLAASLRPAAE